MTQSNVFSTPVVRGYDVVSYFDGAALVGDAAFNAIHEGQTYFFASEANKMRFLASPEKFIPAYGGWCATALSEGNWFAAEPSNFKISEGRLFLFYRGVGGDTRPAWDANEAERIALADKNWSEKLVATK